MLNLAICERETPAPPAPEEPYPNSILPTLDQSFLVGLVPEDPVAVPERFWRRQFSSTVTYPQLQFNWLFGVLMPLLCFLFDPFVFRGSDALLANYRSSVYMVSGFAIVTTMTWLLWGPKLGVLNTFLSGVFAISGSIALLIGIILLPFSLIGMFMIIGLWGFTPLLTSFVLFRNAVRAYRTASL